MDKLSMEANNHMVRYGHLKLAKDAIKDAYMMNEDKRALVSSIEAEMSQINVVLRGIGAELRSTGESK